MVCEFWRMSTSQQESLRAEGVSRHAWERNPAAGHLALFMHPAWEIGRLSAYVKNYSSTQDKIDFGNPMQDASVVGFDA